MRRLYIFWGLTLLLWCVSGQAQKVIYVSAAKGQDYGQGTFTSPYQTVRKALEQVHGETEIRIMEGEYDLEKEIVIPVGVTLLGGYRTDQETRFGNAAEKTILKGNGRSRVVTLAGTLDGVTVKEGFAQGGNGGGVYIKSGGKLMNCIITKNKASYRFPKVGDLLMKDKTFMDVSEFMFDKYAEVEGVVCWVNTDQGAAPGEQGMAVSTDCKLLAWGTSGCSLGGMTFYPYEETALTDMDGKGHTAALPACCAGAEWCKAKGEGWIFPSLGMIGLVATEWDALEKTFSALYDEMYGHYGYGQEMLAFFGHVAYGSSTYSTSGHYFRNNAAWGSSTLKSATSYWKIEDVITENEVTSSRRLTETAFVFGVIKF